MLNELSNDPIQAAISRLEKQHEEDKQGIFLVDYRYNRLNFHLFVFLYYSCIRKTETGIRTTVPAVAQHTISINSVRALYSI